MRKITLKKNKWADITLAEYARIMEIASDTDLSDAEKDVAVIALLAGVPEDDVWNLPLDEIKMLKIELFFLSSEFDYPKTLNFKRIKIGDWDCEVLPDLNKMSYAQFVDYQTYIKELDFDGISPKKKAEVLSVFFIPRGYKYNDGYDMLELQRAIRENVSILVYNSVWFFFLQKSRHLLDSTATSSASRMKAMSMLMSRKNPLKEKLRHLAGMIKEYPHLIG